MDPALKMAAIEGDVEFLKRAVAEQPPEYFLTRCPKTDYPVGNIIHLAEYCGKIEFVREAMRILSKDIQKQLLFQTEAESNWTPFHVAAYLEHEYSYPLVKLLKETYASFLFQWSEQDYEDYVKPWLALSLQNRTPLHVALRISKSNEPCAMELLLMDSAFESCTIVDEDGNTQLSYALKKGCELVAEKILTSPLPSISLFCSKISSSMPFTYAAYCSDKITRLLLKKCEDWIDKIDKRGFSVLHEWAEEGKTKLCKLLLDGEDVANTRTKVFKKMIFWQEKERSDTPLHIAARKDSELAQILIHGYQQEMSVDTGESQEIEAAQGPPWKIKNINGDTPIHCALSSKHEDLALQILSIDQTVSQIRNNKGESPFFLSVQSGCERAIIEIMKIEEPRYPMLRRNDGTTVIHNLVHCSEGTGRMLLEKYWWIINLRDDQRKTALDFAKQAKAYWLTNLLTNPYLIQKQPFDWIEACKRGEIPALLAFVENCPDLQMMCREQNDTPLHHIKLLVYKDYLKFLRIPWIIELKNTTDHDGATALHRALERKDMFLAKALLLDIEVERIVPDNNGTTAMDLLAKLCKDNDDWEKMCKLIKVNPYLRTSYIQLGTNLSKIRNSLSVVAALFATITFTAGFTLPGGINSVTGQALLAKKAAFSVFLLANAYGMCASMLVLFCLVWSMVSKPDMAQLLVDRSVFILMHSLYAILLAFMIGIYTVIAESSLWASILVFVMCSIIGISANRTILHYVIVKLVPAANRENHERIRLLKKVRKPQA